MALPYLKLKFICDIFSWVYQMLKCLALLKQNELQRVLLVSVKKEYHTSSKSRHENNNIA